MKCVSEKKLSAFYDEALSVAEQAQVRRHVQACPACGERLARIQKMSTALQKALQDPQAEQAIAGLWERLRLQLEEKPSLWQRLGDWLWLNRPVVVPALRVAVVAAAVLLFLSPIYWKQLAFARNVCQVRCLASDRATVMVFQTKRNRMTVIWAFEDKKTGTLKMREVSHEASQGSSV